MGFSDYVLEVPSGPVARCFLREEDGRFVITDLEVREDVRQQGYGRVMVGDVMVGELEEIARQKNCSEVYARDVGLDSEVFWRKVGFSFSHVPGDVDVWRKKL
ncbi:MAG: GNAT family N-acetyltransferase [Conexivisphaerales archaeon]